MFCDLVEKVKVNQLTEFEMTKYQIQRGLRLGSAVANSGNDFVDEFWDKGQHALVRRDLLPVGAMEDLKFKKN